MVHYEFLVEDPSMEAFFQAWLDANPMKASFQIHAFQGKTNLLKRLPSRLRGYRHWLSPSHRLIIVLDRDDEDCRSLKDRLEDMCADAGLRTRRSSPENWQCATCLAIEELEAWYFGDWPAVVSAYPHASPHIPQRKPYRSPDDIAGGTWEAFEREMRKKRYFPGGLEKVRAARTIGAHVDARRSRSPSFRHLCRVIDAI